MVLLSVLPIHVHVHNRQQQRQTYENTQQQHQLLYNNNKKSKDSFTKNNNRRRFLLCVIIVCFCMIHNTTLLLVHSFHYNHHYHGSTATRYLTNRFYRQQQLPFTTSPSSTTITTSSKSLSKTNNHNIINNNNRIRNKNRNNNSLGRTYTTTTTTTTKTIYTPTLTTSKHSSTTALCMALLPLNVDEIELLISTGSSVLHNPYKPTPQQYQSYFGRTNQEKYQRLLEGGIVALIGCCCSYFLSFVLGSFVATILGTGSLLWGILAPELQAYQRNYELLSGRTIRDDYNDDYQKNTGKRKTNAIYETNGLYGALWMGYIRDVCVVESSTATITDSDDYDTDSGVYDIRDFADYTMETDELEKFNGEPYLLRLQLTDYGTTVGTSTLDTMNDEMGSNGSSGRELQIHARMSEEYVHLRPGMVMATLLLSTDVQFTTLAALTDIYIVNTNDHENVMDTVLVGDYPYLNRAGLEELFLKEPDLWNILINQRPPSLQQQRQQSSDMNQQLEDDIYDDDDDYSNDHDDFDPYTNDEDIYDDSNERTTRALVPIQQKQRRRRRR